MNIRSPRTWQRRFLIVTGIAELIIETGSLVFVMFLGYHGFIAGEMGTMLGMFAIAIQLILLPFTALRAATVYGLWKHKRWAYYTAIMLAVLIMLGGLFSLSISPLAYVLVFTYAGITIWAAVTCLRGDCNQ